MRILARTKAEAPKRVKFINKYLLVRFGGRTLAGIVGQRRTAAYKEMVSDFKIELTRSPPSPPDPAPKPNNTKKKKDDVDCGQQLAIPSTSGAQHPVETKEFKEDEPAEEDEHPKDKHSGGDPPPGGERQVDALNPPLIVALKAYYYTFSNVAIGPRMSGLRGMTLWYDVWPMI